MLNDYMLTLKQIRVMKHTIGFSRNGVTGKKHPKYKAYRNYYSTEKVSPNFDILEDLSDKGLMLSRQNGSDRWIFHLSSDGFKVLAEITEVDIQEEEDD